ncbi:hypothetical protein DFH08DRAFT_808780 [Mycena albidolilacea]|uniref:Uncharacterized protein n=1 Tax=Mycena albidolilacea TaxID=1033008 RepID=A0AAD7A352_9AGAR|nr:hypothetical protein DFH08DRAFT_808780 [Mycena albidolilacea]
MSATLGNHPLSTIFDANEESSRLSLDWITEHLVHHSETPQLNQLPTFNCDAQAPADGSDSPIHLANAAVSAGSSVPLADVRAAVRPIHSFNMSNGQQPFAEWHLFEKNLFHERNRLESALSHEHTAAFTASSMNNGAVSTASLTRSGAGLAPSPMFHDRSSVQSTSTEDLFVQLGLAEKKAVIDFLVVNAKSNLITLRALVSQHVGMSKRAEHRKLKDVATLRADFLSHRCTQACLIKSSEAIRAGISPDHVLNDTEYQEYSLVLNLKRKRVLAPEDPRAAKQPRTSVESHEADTSFPVILSQEEKDQIV